MPETAPRVHVLPCARARGFFRGSCPRCPHGASVFSCGISKACHVLPCAGKREEILSLFLFNVQRLQKRGRGLKAKRGRLLKSKAFFAFRGVDGVDKPRRAVLAMLAG
jgi:hypothetical protein